MTLLAKIIITGQPGFWLLLLILLNYVFFIYLLLSLKFCTCTVTLSEKVTCIRV